MDFMELKIARIRQGISLVEMSRRTGIDSGMLSRIEHNRANPTIGTLEKITKELGMKILIK
jgi:transcriptional regulator with XRE-family HTH domain